MHGPEEAVATSWFKERAKGVVTSLQSVCWVFHHLRQALPTGAGLSFVRVLLRWFLSVTLFSPLRKACHQPLGKDYLSDVCVQRTPTSLIAFCVLQSMALKGNLKCNGLYMNMRAAAGEGVLCLLSCPSARVPNHICGHIFPRRTIKQKKNQDVQQEVLCNFLFRKKSVFWCTWKKNVMWYDWFLTFLGGS